MHTSFRAGSQQSKHVAQLQSEGNFIEKTRHVRIFFALFAFEQKHDIIIGFDVCHQISRVDSFVE